MQTMYYVHIIFSLSEESHSIWFKDIGVSLLILAHLAYVEW